MQIYLPDHPNLESRATAAGYRSVQEYVRHLVEEDAGPFVATQPNSVKARGSNWEDKLTDLLEAVEPGNLDVDASRESIYPVR